MSKKNFMNVNTERVYNAIEEATAEPAPKELKRRSRSTEPTAEEIQAAREQGKTQGRKGVKCLRVNMQFTPEIHDYIRTMSRAAGMSITEFTNHVFAQHMEAHQDKYQEVLANRDSL